MSAKNVRHFLFWTSIASWTLGWIVAVEETNRRLPRASALDAAALFLLGAFLGTLWLVLAIVKVIARTWKQERADAAHN
jgi:hypothetical protein